jgi:hypothetical protein
MSSGILQGFRLTLSNIVIIRDGAFLVNTDKKKELGGNCHL